MTCFFLQQVRSILLFFSKLLKPDSIFIDKKKRVFSIKNS